MKQWLFACLLLCSILQADAQETNEFISTDRKALSIPDAETNSTTAIAKFIEVNFITDRGKLRAIYAWVTHNIKYDSDSMYAINWGKDPGAKITVALRRRKGVCENYAAIFNDIALKTGLTSFVVNGYTKQGGSVNRSGHSWCAVQLDGEWLLCDPTWDEGSRNHTNFFLISPGEFIGSHMPFDPLWQLLEHPVSHADFYKGNTNQKKDNPICRFADSIKAFSKLNELQQLEASLARIRQAGIPNDLVKNQAAYIEMLIGIIYEDEEMNLYNSAVADLNKARSIFNDFVEYRNNQFIPAKPDAAINTMLSPIDALLSSAYKKIDKIGRSVENLQYDTGALKNKLDILTGRVQEQLDFLKRYFAADMQERGKMFYK